MEKVGMLKLDLYIAVVLFLFPLGWSMSGFQPNIALACVCWGITMFLLIHAFWLYEKTSHFSVTAKILGTLLAVGAAMLWGWAPVTREYRKEHFTVDSAKFITALKAQSGPRYMIRIGCATASEEACVAAGHFLDFFREAGWTVDGNTVQRVTLGKPEAGILLFLHGTGKIDPTNVHSGLWTLQSESLKTVSEAFRAIGLSAGQRADYEIPEDVIAVHFGYNSIVP